MSTSREGSSTRPGGGWWRGVWGRLARPPSERPDPPAAQAISETEPGYSRESLQAMIERKRHNDLVRRREFGMLRKLMRHEAAGVMPTPHPVTFHSSIPSGVDERATTLRKINEIEAQMSSQWRPVKARQTARRPAGGQLPRPVTESLAPSRLLRSALPIVPPPSVLRTPSQDAEDFIHDPEFEEAALRFASGDTAGAESALRALMTPGHPRAGQAQTWHFLFDLYRASGQMTSHDELGAEFARSFQRSPPQWRDEPAPPDLGEASRAFPVSVVGEPTFDWTCPPVLDAAGVAALQAVLLGLPQPWRLSLLPLSRLEPSAVAPLALLVAHWARQPVRLRLAGAETLERILDARTACGERGVDPAWWALRLDWLRAMRRPEEFELVALDYCVTYEVSPPSWDPPRCDLRRLGPDGAGGPRQPVAALEPRVSTLGVGETAALSAFASSAPTPSFAGELVGVLQGDTAATVLARLESCLQGGDPLVISCEGLHRLDFEAASALANWVCARQREGRTVHLAGVHRLVAALLGAIGLAAQARITLRRD